MKEYLDLKTIKLDLINACNERCSFCPYYGVDGSVIDASAERLQPISKLELNILRMMFDELVLSKLYPQIKVSGMGEGTLHPDFDKIVESAHIRGLEVRVITNGTLIKKHKQSIEDNVSTLVVSIHGNEPLHDSIVSRKGAYKDALEGVISLQTKDKTLKKIILAYVITPANIPYMVNHIRLCDELHAEPRFHHDFKPTYNYKKPFDVSTLQKAIEAVKSRYSSVKFIPDLSPKSLKLYYSQDRFVLNPHRCDRVSKEIEIRSNGEVYTCRSEVFGNINKRSIVYILLDGKRKQFLKDIDHEKRSKGLDPNKCDRCCYQADYVLER